MKLQLQRHCGSGPGDRTARRTRRITTKTHHCHPTSRRPVRRLVPEWLSRDPIGEDGGLNVVAYVLNNPISLLDFLGLKHFEHKVTATTPTYTYTDYRGITTSRGGDQIGATIKFDVDAQCTGGKLSNVTYSGFEGRLNSLYGNRFELGIGLILIWEEHEFNDTTVDNDLKAAAGCQAKEKRIKVEWTTKAGVDFTPSIGPVSPFPAIPGPVLVDKKITDLEFVVTITCSGDKLTIQ